MSGIPLASDMAQQALRWAMAIGKNQLPEDPRIRESDVRLFMEAQPWFNTSLPADGLYQNAMRMLNTPRELRRKFLMEIVHEASSPSEGYKCLANLTKRGLIRTILTTNFDDRFEAAYAPGALIVVSNRDEYKAISTAPQLPQMIYLHGRAEYYMDRIMTDEVQTLDDDLISRILPLLRDHPLIVVGYRGAEPSVMKTIFLDHLATANYFPRGIFWCLRDAEDEYSLSPMARCLARNAADNFALVRITGFDEFMAEFADNIIEDPTQRGLGSANSIDGLPDSGFSFDLEKTPHVSKDCLNLPELYRIVSEHSKRIGIDVPYDANDEWYELRSQLMGLLVRNKHGELEPTNAAVLLFSDQGRKVSRGHWVEIRTPERPPSAIDGSLLHIYEETFGLLQSENRPIRIKGYRSRSQLRYGPIAIKELLANALIHRDYRSSDPTIISIGKDHITFENPGGLNEPIVRQLARTSGANISDVGEEFQERVYRRDLGASYTAYRNPVLADVFWGLGHVDKAGSGLMDAVHTLREIGGDARIQVPESNNTFTATISMPNITIDDATQTAIPKRPTLYFSNLVEFESIPSLVWAAKSHVRTPRDAHLIAGDQRLPSFSLSNGQLYSFADVSEENCMLRMLIDIETARNCRLDELIDDESTRRIVPELLRRVFESHLSVCGLRVDRRRRRAYYVCYNRSFRSISYRATNRVVSR